MRLLILEPDPAERLAALVAEHAHYDPAASRPRLRVTEGPARIAEAAACAGVGSVDRSGRRWTINGAPRSELVLRWCLARRPLDFLNGDPGVLYRLSTTALCAAPGCPAEAEYRRGFCRWHVVWTSLAADAAAGRPRAPRAASGTSDNCVACDEPLPRHAPKETPYVQRPHRLCATCAAWIAERETQFYARVNPTGTHPAAECISAAWTMSPPWGVPSPFREPWSPLPLGPASPTGTRRSGTARSGDSPRGAAGPGGSR